jgi:hypothetical protein
MERMTLLTDLFNGNAGAKRAAIFLLPLLTYACLPAFGADYSPRQNAE